MVANQLHWSICKLMSPIIAFLTLVAIGNATKVPTTTVPGNGSLLINATARPQPLDAKKSEIMNYLKCTQRPLVDPHYNRILQPIPSEGPEKRLGVMHTDSEEKKNPKSQPVNVRIILDILRIMDINEHKGIIVLLLNLKQFWTDNRIKPPPEYIDECPKIKRLSNNSVRYLPDEVSKTLWFPDVYLNRVEDLHISKVLVNSEAVWVNSHGDVEYTIFGKFKVSCEMNFRNFPLDVQYCPVYVESWRIRTTEQILTWDPKHPIGLLRDYSLDQFSLSVLVLRVARVQYNSDDFSRIGFVMIFSRKLPFYLLQIYLPTVLFVIISWLTFFIPPPYAQGRIILTITTLLALTALNSLISKHSPSASYLRGIDVWMQSCFLFVFVAIVDCLVDIRLLFLVSQSYKQEKPSFLMPVSVALVENRQVFDHLFGGEGDEGDGGNNEADATPSIYCDAPEPGPSMADLPLHRDSSKRVSFVDEMMPGTKSLVSPQLQRADSGLLQVPETPEDLSEELERRAIMFEKISIIVYPVLFALFNVCYWGYYLHASQPPERLVEEISGGFTPLQR